MRAAAIAAAVATSEATPSVLGKRIRVKEEPLEDEPPRKRRKLREDVPESDFDGIEIKTLRYDPEQSSRSTQDDRGYSFDIPEPFDGLRGDQQDDRGYDFYIPEQVDL